jgi:hypothetical protein
LVFAPIRTGFQLDGIRGSFQAAKSYGCYQPFTTGELDVHLLNHVSARYDRTHVQAGLAEWLTNHADVLVEEIDN